MGKGTEVGKSVAPDVGEQEGVSTGPDLGVDLSTETLATPDGVSGLQDGVGNGALLELLAKGQEDERGLRERQARGTEMVAESAAELASTFRPYDADASLSVFEDLADGFQTLDYIQGERVLGLASLKSQATKMQAGGDPSVDQLSGEAGRGAEELHEDAIQEWAGAYSKLFDAGVPDDYIPSVKAPAFPTGTDAAHVSVRYRLGPDLHSLKSNTTRLIESAPKSGEPYFMWTGRDAAEELDKARGTKWRFLFDALSQPDSGVHPEFVQDVGEGSFRTVEEAYYEKELFEANLERGVRGEGESEMEDVLAGHKGKEQEGQFGLEELVRRATVIEGQLAPGGGDDLDEVNEALRGLNRYEIDFVKSRLWDRGLVLKVTNQMRFMDDEAELDEFRANLSGDTVSACLAALEESVEWWNDEGKIRRVLEGLTPSERKELARRIDEISGDKRRFHAVLEDLDDGLFTIGNTANIAAAHGEDDMDLATAYKIYEAINNPGTDIEALRTLLDPKVLTPIVRGKFTQITGGETIKQWLADESLAFEAAGTRTELDGYLEGDMGKVRAARTFQALRNPDQDWVSGKASGGDVLKELESEGVAFGGGMSEAQQSEQEQLETQYSIVADGQDLEAGLDRTFGSIPAEIAEALMANTAGYAKENRAHNTRVTLEQARLQGAAHPARKLYLNLQGGRKNGVEVVAILAKMGLAEIHATATTYDRLFERSLEDDVEENLSGTDRLDGRLAMLGKDITPGVIRQSALILEDFNEAELEVAGLAKERFLAYHKQILAQTEGRDGNTEAAWAEYSPEERRELELQYVALKQSSTNYQQARRELADHIVTGAGMTLGALATFVTGGAAAPWIVAVLTTSTEIGLKRALVGEEYSGNEVAKDALLGALSMGLDYGPLAKVVKDVSKDIGGAAAQELIEHMLKTGLTTAAGEGLDAMGLGDGEFDVDTIFWGVVKAGITKVTKDYFTDWAKGDFDAFGGPGRKIFAQVVGDVHDATVDLALTRNLDGKTPKDLFFFFAAAGGSAFLDTMVDHFTEEGLTMREISEALGIQDLAARLGIPDEWDRMDAEVKKRRERGDSEEEISAFVAARTTELSSTGVRDMMDFVIDAETMDKVVEGKDGLQQELLREKWSTLQFQRALEHVDGHAGESPEKITESAPPAYRAEVAQVLKVDDTIASSGQSTSAQDEAGTSAPQTLDSFGTTAQGDGVKAGGTTPSTPAPAEFGALSVPETRERVATAVSDTVKYTNFNDEEELISASIRLETVLNESTLRDGAPEITVLIAEPGTLRGIGVFDSTKWILALDAHALQTAKDPAVATALVMHERRHVEQVWNIALQRASAALGNGDVPDAKALSEQMRIPLEVAEAAYEEAGQRTRAPSDELATMDQSMNSAPGRDRRRKITKVINSKKVDEATRQSAVEYYFSAIPEERDAEDIGRRAKVDVLRREAEGLRSKKSEAEEELAETKELIAYFETVDSDSARETLAQLEAGGQQLEAEVLPTLQWELALAEGRVSEAE